MGSIYFSRYSDKIGIISSFLCLIHCLITPFIFILKACSETCCSQSPIWWQSIDYLFLTVAFIAIWSSTQKKMKYWLRISFWLSWSLLLVVILNESLQLIHLSNYLLYIPALLIVALHFYNLIFCKCSNDICCHKTN